MAVCAYCGNIGNTTRDHVIPKCLFPRPLPTFMMTVPACESCNNRKSRHDDFMRDMMVTDVAVEDNPVTQRLFEDKTLRSHEQGKSLLARIALQDSQPVDYLKADGTSDVAYASKFDLDRAEEMFGYIVRGLYYAIFNAVLSATTDIRVRRFFKSEVDRAIELFKEFDSFRKFSLGDGIFSCAYMHGEDTPEATLWIMEFYGSIHYSAVTTPVGAEVTPEQV